MSGFELKLSIYQGPLEKLLEFIEAKELSISEISLAQITDDFLEYLRALQEERIRLEGEGRSSDFDLRLLADFIVVASRLIFIKSKSLIPDIIPSSEDESDIRDLTERLTFYKQLRPAMKHIASLWAASRTEYSRPYFLTMSKSFLVADQDMRQGEPIKLFFPGQGVSTESLGGSLRKIFESLEKIHVEEEIVREKIVTLEEKIAQVIRGLRDFVETTFKNLTHTESRAERIVSFLAILHLAREQKIFLDQEHHLSDIMITQKHV